MKWHMAALSFQQYERRSDMCLFNIILNSCVYSVVLLSCFTILRIIILRYEEYVWESLSAGVVSRNTGTSHIPDAKMVFPEVQVLQITPLTAVSRDQKLLSPGPVITHNEWHHC